MSHLGNQSFSLENIAGQLANINVSHSILSLSSESAFLYKATPARYFFNINGLERATKI